MRVSAILLLMAAPHTACGGAIFYGKYYYTKGR